jgi:hypothetical protein
MTSRAAQGGEVASDFQISGISTAGYDRVGVHAFTEITEKRNARMVAKIGL